ncbi:DUF3158 family protein [Pseudomonas bijieensis]|uniref:DUF3158 family protein n=1 Tax=Pseudomonas bijieensis TaxID=2681983 RepID=UPI00200D9205|nr:DUF3158 family protein [Pseudomonas bijieensis]UQI28531.1 DUF3158 family protein [Pseudomonas bijieensis]
MALHYFAPLAQSDFEQLQHTAYLKGLFKPFKGKGALEDWASECIALRDELQALAQGRILTQARRYPFNLLAAQLTPHSTGAGTTFLRWRSPDRRTMGVSLWQHCIENEATPNLVIEDLYALEQQRIVLNMQIGLLHTLARQANDCALKMAYAEEIYQRCITQRTLT